MATGKADLLNRKLLYLQFTIPIGTVSGGSFARKTVSEAGYTIPNGYAPVAMTYFSTGNQHLMLSFIMPNRSTSTENFISLRNGSSSAVGSSSSPISAVLRMLFAPTETVKIITSDEQAEGVGDISSEPIFKRCSFSSAYTAEKGTYGSITKTMCGFFIPNGYDFFGITNISAGSAYGNICSCNPVADSRFLVIRNNSGTTDLSSTGGVTVTFINNKYKDHITIENE